MRTLLILFVYFFFTINASSEEKEYKFNWYPLIDIKDNVIDFPDSSKYETYNASGVWEDNLGNYGMMKCNISQLISSSKEISLDGYCEAIDSEKEQFWLSLSML